MWEGSVPVKNIHDKEALREDGGRGNRGVSDDEAVSAALRYLFGLQRDDGGWGTSQDGPSSIHMTAMVVMLLRRFPPDEDRRVALEKATGYLLARQYGDGGFGDAFSTVHETALASHALEGLLDGPEAVVKAKQYLVRAQSENGSWNDDLYSTVLALEACVPTGEGLAVTGAGEGETWIEEEGHRGAGPGDAEDGYPGADGTPSGSRYRAASDESGDGGTAAKGQIRGSNERTKISLVSRRKASAVSIQDAVQDAPLSVRSVIVRSVGTDRKEYGPNETVRICSTIENRSEADFSIVVNAQLADARGHIVDVAAHETGPAVKLGAGASEPVMLLWNTGMSQPGAYSVRFHVADAASGSVVDERKLAFVIVPSVALEDLDLVVTPSSLDQYETKTVEMRLTLQNRSNTDAVMNVEVLMKDPEGTRVHEGRVAVDVPSSVPERILELPALTHVFDRCGQYLVEVSVRSGEVLCGQVRSAIRVAPATRIEVVKTVDPATVTPDGDKEVRVSIRLEGVGATVNPSLLSAVTNSGGDRILLSFDKAMAQPAVGVPMFTVTADGVPCAVLKVRLRESDITRIDLVLAAPAAKGQEIRVGYAGSSLTCIEGKPLMPFDDEEVANRVSPPIFNQDGYGFSGPIPPNPLTVRTVMTGYGEWPRGFYKNVLAFAGAVFDGKAIWMVPANADSVVRLETDTGEMTAFNHWPEGFRKGNLAFAGAVFDGKAIWMVPANADSVVRLETDTGEMTAFNHWPEGFSKGGHAFAGGVFDGECLWMVPSYADSVVKLDTGTGEMTRYNGWPKGFSKGGYAFAGGIYDGRFIWMVPANADSVVRMDTHTGEMSACGGWPEGLGKVEYAFAGGVFDGRYIWLVPYYADRVVRVDTQTGEMTGHHQRPEGLGKVEYAFAGAVFDGQGVWMVPLNADRIVRIDKDTAEATEYPEWPQGFIKGVNAFAGGVFDGECIWMVPSYADRVVRISSFSSLSLSASVTASDAFSAYISQDESGEGRLAGQGKGWSSVHTLHAPLVPGLTNYLHVKCVDTAGPVAAFMADIFLNDESFHFADGSRHLVTSEGGWRVYTDRFGGTEGPVTAVCKNGEGSWSTRFGIDLDAKWIWTGRGVDRGTRFFSTPIYYSPVPIAPMEDVVITETVAGGKVTVDERSFTREPSRVERGEDGTIVEWRLEEFRVGQREDFSFNVMLRDTVPGEERLVNRSLKVAYRDVRGAMAERELGSSHVRVLSSPFAGSIGTQRQVYGVGEDVDILCSVRNLSDLPRTLDVRVTMEDAQGVLIEESLVKDVRCEPGEERDIDGLAFKLVATNAGLHRLRLLLHEGQEERVLAATGFTVEDVPATGVSLRGSGPAGGQADTPDGEVDSEAGGDGSDGGLPSEGVGGQASEEGLPEGLPEGLEGTVNAQPSPIFQGLSETIYYTVSHGAGGDLTGLSVNVVIAEGETGKARQSFLAPRAHLKGGSFAGSFTFSTGALEPGEYMVKLVISPGSGSEGREIAATSFVIRRIEMVVT